MANFMDKLSDPRNRKAIIAGVVGLTAMGCLGALLIGVTQRDNYVDEAGKQDSQGIPEPPLENSASESYSRGDSLGYVRGFAPAASAPATLGEARAQADPKAQTQNQNQGDSSVPKGQLVKKAMTQFSGQQPVPQGGGMGTSISSREPGAFSSRGGDSSIGALGSRGTAKGNMQARQKATDNRRGAMGSRNRQLAKLSGFQTGGFGVDGGAGFVKPMSALAANVRGSPAGAPPNAGGSVSPVGGAQGDGADSRSGAGGGGGGGSPTPEDPCVEPLPVSILGASVGIDVWDCGPLKDGESITLSMTNRSGERISKYISTTGNPQRVIFDNLEQGANTLEIAPGNFGWEPLFNTGCLRYATPLESGAVNQSYTFTIINKTPRRTTVSALGKALTAKDVINNSTCTVPEKDEGQKGTGGNCQNDCECGTGMVCGTEKVGGIFIKSCWKAKDYFTGQCTEDRHCGCAGKCVSGSCGGTGGTGGTGAGNNLRPIQCSNCDQCAKNWEAVCGTYANLAIKTACRAYMATSSWFACGLGKLACQNGACVYR